MIFAVIAIYLVGFVALAWFTGKMAYDKGVTTGTFYKRTLHRGNKRYAILHGIGWGWMWPLVLICIMIWYPCSIISDWVKAGERW